MNESWPEPARRAVLVSADPPPSARLDGEYEYRLLSLPRGTSRGEARRALTEHAEYGRWELAMVQLTFGGQRRIWLRRRIIRVTRSA